MAKQTGLGDNFYIGAYNPSCDIQSLGAIGGGNEPLDVTGICKSAMERLGGKRDGRIEFVTFFNDADDQEHEALRSLPTTDVIMSYFRGTALGNAAASINCKQVNYDPTRATDGSLVFDVQALANGFGLEWGRQGTAGVRTDSAAATGTAWDDSGSAGTTSFGLQMYVHLFAFTGTSVTIKLQGSSDNGVGDPFADITGATTGALTTPQAIRVATASNASIERYLRVVTSGTFSNAVFAVNVVRNEVTPVF